MAPKADVREELDRLASHVEAARTLMADDAAAGRRLDFLTQEFMREANTLCAKSATVELTRTGLALKAAIDQFREQVQAMSSERARRGLLMLVVSSPSGVGQTSLSRRLVADHAELDLSISMTTRPPRPGEHEGREYFFVSEDEFTRQIEAGAFPEWAKVHDHHRSAPRRAMR